MTFTRGALLYAVASPSVFSRRPVAQRLLIEERSLGRIVARTSCSTSFGPTFSGTCDARARPGGYEGVIARHERGEGLSA